jgi:NAD(P)-dependent dehydrogenase (short-subunit alcohol dehydrogenase family)
MGRAVATRLAGQGIHVAVNDINPESAADTANALESAVAIPGDVTDKATVTATVAQATQALGPIDILINNAGILYPTRVEDISEEEWDRVIAVNLRATFLCSQAVLPGMRASKWGRIVNFSSTAGKSVSTIGGAHYTAAKAGILGFTRHLSREVAADGITVNAVCPGLIDTEMVQTTIPSDKVKAYADSFPIPRLGQPREVADLVAFLASDEAAYITGASLDINGGDLTI